MTAIDKKISVLCPAEQVSQGAVYDAKTGLFGHNIVRRQELFPGITALYPAEEVFSLIHYRILGVRFSSPCMAEDDK